MDTKILNFLLMLLIIVMLTGCAENSKGGFGPSWDVPLQVPAIREGQALNDFSGADDFNKFGYKINSTEDIDFSLYGSQDNQIKKTREVDLPLLNFNSGLINVLASGTVINGKREAELKELNFSKFDYLKLSSSYSNQFDLTLDNTGSSTIDNLTVKLKDKAGNVIASNNFQNVVGSASGTFDLKGQTLESGMKLAIALDQSSGASDFNFTMTSGSLTVTKVEGLKADQLSKTSLKQNFSTNLDLGNQTPKVIDEDPDDADSDSYGAHLDLSFDFPSDSNLSFDLTNISLGNNSLSDIVDPSGYYDIDIGTNLNDELAVTGDLKNTATRINYDSSKTVDLTASIYGGVRINPPSDVRLEATADNYLLYQLDPSDFDLDNDDLDQLDDNLKEAKLVMDYGNQLGVDLSATVYVANTKDKTKLYKESNKVADIVELERGTGKHEFILDKEFRDKFRDKTYLGIELKLGDGTTEVSFSSAENLSMDAYAVLTTKVNQDN